MERSAVTAGLVAVALPNRIEAFIAAFGVLRTRHALTLVHPDLPLETRSTMLSALRPAAEVVAHGTTLRVVPEPYGAALPLWQAPLRRRDLGIALCVLTSGSSGRPRPVAATHRQVLFSTAMIARRLCYEAGDIVAIGSPLSFDYGFYQLLLAATAGATVVLDPELGTVQGLIYAIARAGVTVLPLVPTMLRALTASPSIHRVSTLGVRLITTTGDLLSEADVRAAQSAFPNAVVLPMYGLSECKRVAITPAGALRPPGAVGLPLDETDVAVVGPQGHRLGNGSRGALVVAGPHVTLGYVGDEVATAERFRISRRSGIRLLRTGDRLSRDDAGWLHWVGRGSEVIKTRGYRIDPAEIETAAAVCPLVIESGAYGRADRDQGEVPVLVARVDGDAAQEAARGALTETLHRLLPRWAWPEVVLTADALPRTRNGKIARSMLRSGEAGGSLSGDDEQMPAPERPLIQLCDIPSSRRTINCHVQALLSSCSFPFPITAAELDLLTTVPFGVRSVPGDLHRLLVPYLDPDRGLDRACELLGIRMETAWFDRGAGEDATRLLDRWLRTGPVVLGPLDLGLLKYNELAGTLHGCDHYVVALGRDEAGEFVVIDPEGFVQVAVAEPVLWRAWANEAPPEGRGSFTLRRLSLDDGARPWRPPDLLPKLAAMVVENLVLAGAEPTGGAGAYSTLAGLDFGPSCRRSLGLLLPATAFRYRLGATLARTFASERLASGWYDLGELLEQQVVALAIAHRDVVESAGPPRSLGALAARERQIAQCALDLEPSVGT